VSGQQEVESFTFEDDGGIPNSPLPVLIYHAIREAGDAAACEELFARHGWPGAWRNGIFSFHHFHSTAHEVLGIVAGTAAVVLGGPRRGKRFQVGRGDVLVLPAGTGHCNVGSTGDLLVIGGYADGRGWDIRRGDPSERDEVLANIKAVPLPQADPVHGREGPLTELWGAAR
jgi:uncharacterized protein YjlB